MSEIPTIGDVVREWRQYLQISLTEFSQTTKLSKGYISELEHNKINNPKKDKLERLAAALQITVMDILSRRMPPKDGGAVTTPSSKQGVARQGGQQVSVDKDEAGEEEEEEQENGTPTDSAGHPSISIRSLPSSTTGGKVDRLIASGRFSEEEEMEVEAAVIELINRFISFKETQRKMQKGD